MPETTQYWKTATKRQAKAELIRRNLRRYYQGRPEKWLTQMYGLPPQAVQWSLHPEYQNHEWDGTPDPFLTACTALAEKRNVGIEAGTGTGKTYMLARLGYWFLDVYPNSLVVTTAPKQGQLKTIFWSEVNSGFTHFRKVRPRAQKFSLRVLPLGSSLMGTQEEQESGSDDWQMVGIVSGVGADEASATKMQGFHRENMLFIMDEAAGISPAVVTAIKNTSVGGNNLICALGNPDSVTDALHQFCELPTTEHIRVSAYDHPNVVLKRDIIPGAVTQVSIDERETEYGKDSSFAKSRVRGIAPAQATDALILHEWVARACTWREEFDHNIIDQNVDASYADSFNAVGVDVADSDSGDGAALVWGQRNVVKLIEEFACKNANALADNVVKDSYKLAEEEKLDYHTATISDFNISPEHIGVDSVGVGAGTINRFDEMNYDVVSIKGGADKSAIPTDRKGEPLYEFMNARAQIMFQLRLDLMKGEIIFDFTDRRIRQQLIFQLTDIKYKVAAKSISIERKIDIKKRHGGKSPNILDAVAYWNWVRKTRGSRPAPTPFLIR